VQFSIIIPLYNKAAYIEPTIRSVLHQRFSDFEIVVVDDGSTDGGESIVKNIDDPRIRLIRQSNSGVSMARNAGIEQAAGDWIVFLDADDWQHPDYLSTLAELAASADACSALATRYRSVNLIPGQTPTTWPVESPRTTEKIQNLPRRWMQGTTFFTGSIAIKRETLNSLAPCFPPGESYGEDLDLWFRLAEKGPILLCHQPLIARVLVSNGLSVTKRTTSEPPFLLRMEARSKTGMPSASYCRSAAEFVQHCRVTLARDALEQGARWQAFKLIWRSKSMFVNRRWIATLLMCFLASRNFSRKWHKARKQGGALT
jgi:glycosyltransferase involved in cell wall biosynthesis